MEQTKHQKELMIKYKLRSVKCFPYPLFTIIAKTKTQEEERFFLIDFLSYFYYYIFLIFRHRFPIVAYEVSKDVYELKISYKNERKEINKHKENTTSGKFWKTVMMFIGPISVLTNRAFGKYITKVVLFITPHARTINMVILILVCILVFYEIIKRTNELKQALQLDGVKKYKLRVTKKVELGFKNNLIILGAYIFPIIFSSFVFMLPKDRIILFFSLPLPFLTAYCWWFLLYMPYLEVEEIEIIKELEY